MTRKPDIDVYEVKNMEWKKVLEQQKLEYTVLYDMSKSGLMLLLVDADRLWEQDENARTMSRGMFNQLTQNIKIRGALESVVFTALTTKGVEIVSGHHRIRSLRAAKKLDKTINMQIPILVDISGLTRSEIRAKQLAHNSISGEDDPQMLRRIYLQIKSADLRLQTFIDETKLNIAELDKVKVTPLLAGFDFEHVKLFFLPTQMADFESAMKMLDGTEDKVYLATKDTFLKFADAVSETMEKEDIRSIGTALAYMSEIVLAHFKSKSSNTTKAETKPQS